MKPVEEEEEEEDEREEDVKEIFVLDKFQVCWEETDSPVLYLKELRNLQKRSNLQKGNKKFANVHFRVKNDDEIDS